MCECFAVLEEVHLVDEVVQEVEIVGAKKVAHDTGRGGRCCCLSDHGHVIEAEVVELGDVELVELVGADEGANVVDLESKLLTLAPLCLIGFFYFVLRLDEQLDVLVALIL